MDIQIMKVALNKLKLHDKINRIKEKQRSNQIFILCHGKTLHKNEGNYV